MLYLFGKCHFQVNSIDTSATLGHCCGVFLADFNVLCLLGIIHLVLETVTVRCSVKKDVLKNFAKFTVIISVRVSFLIKLQGKASNIVKMRLWFSCFPVNCTEFFYRISHPPNQIIVIH